MDPKAPAHHHAPLEIAPETFLIRSLYGEGEAPVAVYVNSMVIRGAEPIVVDTGTYGNRERWLDDVFSLVEPEDIRWVFLSHDDHDHVGNLVPLLEAAPQATLVTTWFSGERLVGDMDVPLARQRWVNDGESFDAGDRTLVAVRPPIYDSPTTRSLFDPITGVLWAADAFATAVPVPVDDVADLDPEFWAESFSVLNRVVSPWHELVDPAKFEAVVDKTARLDPTIIASGHSPVITGRNVDEAFRMTSGLAGAEPAPLPGQPDLDALVAAATGVAA
ncbi:MAG TPA: MBL fold metallo-hydrolase [Iamia sp.]